MIEVLKELRETPLPLLLILAGIAFLFLSVVRKLGTTIETDPGRERTAQFIGAALLVFGMGLYFFPSAGFLPATVTPAPSPTALIVAGLGSPTPLPPALISTPTIMPSVTIPTLTPTIIVPTATAIVIPPTAKPIIAVVTATPSCTTVRGAFAAVWSQVREKIGCAQSVLMSDTVVEENFQNGKMFWRKPIDYEQILVLFNDGSWKLFQHAPYVEGSPEYSCVDSNTPPRSPPTPRRGFGLVWCDIPEIRASLANATDEERGYTGYMQDFDNGFMIQTDKRANFVFYGSGSGAWERK